MNVERVAERLKMSMEDAVPWDVAYDVYTLLKAMPKSMPAPATVEWNPGLGHSDSPWILLAWGDGISADSPWLRIFRFGALPGEAAMWSVRGGDRYGPLNEFRSRFDLSMALHINQLFDQTEAWDLTWLW